IHGPLRGCRSRHHLRARHGSAAAHSRQQHDAPGWRCDKRLSARAESGAGPSAADELPQMSNASITQRLTRQLGTSWPNHEQQLVLQAIFAEPERAREAYLAWRGTLDIEQPFDGAVMRLLPLLYLRLLKIGLNDPLTGRLKGVYRRAWSDTHTLFHG